LAKGLIQFAMCGDPGNRSPYGAVKSLNSQKILLLMNSGPTSPDLIASKLGLTGADVNDELERLRRSGLIIESHGRVSPAFPIFTVKDQTLLKTMIGSLSRQTAGIVKTRMSDVKGLIEGLSLAERRLRFPDLKYILVGAMTLDYSGLRVLKEEKLLCPMKKMPGNGNYVFSGLESGLFDLKKGWMWGHVEQFGRYWFSSHGRLPKGFRLAFPDVARQWADQVQQSTVIAKMEKIGRLLELLSQEDLSLANLKAKTGRTDDLVTQLTMLLGLGYVVLVDKKWRINRPFFTADDLEKTKKVSESILGDIAKSLNAKREKILEKYADTSPSNNNIPFEEAFNPLYHLIFEQALDQLMRNRTIHPPLSHSNGRYSPFIALGMENLLKVPDKSTQ
jgi:hypothetical protein